MIEFNKQKDANEFIAKMTKLAPELIITLAKVLDVKMSEIDPETKEITLRDATEIVEDCLNKFLSLKHKQRKMVLKAMEK
jgi:hypothetical protein